MTGPSENAFMATMFVSVAATLAGIWTANRVMMRRPPGDLKVRLGPAMSARSVGLTLIALLAASGAVGLVAVALHHAIGDAMLWFLAIFLVPVSLGPTLIVAMRAVAADARGALQLDGDTLIVTWDGDERRWHLPDCTATLRLTPAAVSGADAALLLMIDGPTGFLPVVFPLVGIPGVQWTSALQLPDGWFHAPGGAAFPASDPVFVARPLVDALLARVATVDRGGG